MVQSQSTSRFRPLSATEIINQGIEAYRRLFRQLAPISLVLSGVAYIAFFAVLAVAWSPVLRRLQKAASSGPASFRLNISASQLVVPFIVLAIVALLFFLLQLVQSGALVAVVGQGYVGARPNWRSALPLGLKRARSILWVLVLLDLLFGVCGVLFLLLTGVVVAVHLGAAAPLLILLLVVAVVYVGIHLALIVPVVMFEQTRGFAVVRRSFRLVTGRFWGTFGALLLAWILAMVVNVVVQLAIGIVGRAGAGGAVIGLLIGLIVELLIAPWLPVVTAFLYFDLKNRAEGIDLGAVATNLGVVPGAISPPPAPPTWPPPGASWPPPSPGWPPPGPPSGPSYPPPGPPGALPRYPSGEGPYGSHLPPPAPGSPPGPPPWGAPPSSPSPSIPPPWHPPAPAGADESRQAAPPETPPTEAPSSQSAPPSPPPPPPVAPVWPALSPKPRPGHRSGPAAPPPGAQGEPGEPGDEGGAPRDELAGEPEQRPSGSDDGEHRTE